MCDQEKPMTATELLAKRAEYARLHRGRDSSDLLLWPIVERIHAILRKHGILSF